MSRYEKITFELHSDAMHERKPQNLIKTLPDILIIRKIKFL